MTSEADAVPQIRIMRNSGLPVAPMAMPEQVLERRRSPGALRMFLLPWLASK